MKTILIITVSTLVFAGCAMNYNNTPSETTMQKNITKQVKFLTDSKGMTLYTFDKDSKNRSNCYNGCEKKWPIFTGGIDNLTLPASINTNNFGTIKRDDGKMQTTYMSKPLYYFFKDTKANEINGDGKKGVWHLVHFRR